MKMIVALLLGSILVGSAEAQSGGAFQLFRFDVSKQGVQSPVWFADMTGAPLQTDESAASYPLPGSGRFVAMSLHVYENSSDGPLRAILRLNQTPTTLVVTVPAGSEGVFTVSGDIPFGPNNLLSVEIDYSQATSGEVRATGALHYVVQGSNVAEVPLDRTALGILVLALGVCGIYLLSPRRSTA